MPWPSCSTGPNGTTGTVQILNSQGQPKSSVSLPAGAVQINGNQVQIEFPAHLLPVNESAANAYSRRALFLCLLGRDIAHGAQRYRQLRPRTRSPRWRPKGFPGERDDPHWG